MNARWLLHRACLGRKAVCLLKPLRLSFLLWSFLQKVMPSFFLLLAGDFSVLAPFFCQRSVWFGLSSHFFRIALQHITSQLSHGAETQLALEGASLLIQHFSFIWLVISSHWLPNREMDSLMLLLPYSLFLNPPLCQNKPQTLKGIWKLFDFNIFKGVGLGLSPKIAIVKLASYHVLNVCYIFYEVFSLSSVMCQKHGVSALYSDCPHFHCPDFSRNSDLGRQERGRTNSNTIQGIFPCSFLKKSLICFMFSVLNS